MLKNQSLYLSLALLLGGLAIFVCVPHVQKAVFIGQPTAKVLEVPDSLTSLTSVEGQRLLETAAHKSDYAQLVRYFRPQIYLSYCGVATGVTVANALIRKPRHTQSTWFDRLAGNTQSAYETFFGGMTLVQFDGLLSARGFQTQRVHGGVVSLATFRRRVVDNMQTPRDAFVINYHRSGVNQKGGGHFSPLAAYHEASDQVLILDVAAHKYPPVWAPLESVWKALDTTDKSAHAQRGFLEVEFENERLD